MEQQAKAMGKVKQLRETELMVGGEIAFWTKTGRDPVEVTLKGIPCIWLWDDCGRDAAEYWTLVDFFSQHFEYSDFRVLSYWSSPKNDDWQWCSMLYTCSNTAKRK